MRPRPCGGVVWRRVGVGGEFGGEDRSAVLRVLAEEEGSGREAEDTGADYYDCTGSIGGVWIIRGGGGNGGGEFALV